MRVQKILAGPRVVAPKVVLQKTFASLVFLLLLSLTFSVHPSASARAADAPIRILAFGDSLTAGYGLDNPGDAFPAQLEKALRAKGHNVAIIQGGLSGDTTSGGRSRLEWSLADKPDAVIVELGGNDGLRAVDPKITAENLQWIVKRLQRDNIPVLLAGMMAPPNLGRDFGARFNAIFSQLAKETGVPLYPFFLEGAITVPGMMQNDQIHPNAKGVQAIVKGILPMVEKLVDQVKAQKAK
jgi:acyl-CoA thioesterase-1